MMEAVWCGPKRHVLPMEEALKSSPCPICELVAERDRLREALERIASHKPSSTSLFFARAQNIAREALNADSTTEGA